MGACYQFYDAWVNFPSFVFAEGSTINIIALKTRGVDFPIKERITIPNLVHDP